MAHTIACRIASYGDYQDRGWSHLPEIGVGNVEIPVPPADQIVATRKRLADHGLTATSLQAKVDITQVDAVEVMKPQVGACSEFGARICFVSMKAGEAERGPIWDRLRAIGDVAAEANVTIAIETHPDLATNGEIALATMKSIEHPNVRINYDTANIYFYNEDIDTVEELKKMIDYVGAVHLKDTNGQYKTWHFPSLGEGVVDFPAIFKLLDDRNFTGPYTMELEGVEGVTYDEPARLAYIAKSVDYLRSIGVMN